MSKHTTLEQLRTAQLRAKAAVDAVSAVANGAIRSGQLVNHVASFFTSTDCSGTAAFTMDIPEEMFLDQAKTKFVDNFTWSAAEYPGSTEPNPILDGKPVFVLAVKGEDAAADPSYSFLNMEALVDTYSGAAGDGSTTVTVSGYTIAVNVNLSSDTGNIITKDAQGKLYAQHQDISGKADLDLLADEYDATTTYAVGDLCVYAGNLYRCSAAIETAEAWTAGHWAETDVAAEFASRDSDLANKADKIVPSAAGNLAGLNAQGNLTDSGVAAVDVVTKIDSPTANNLVKQDANGKIADAGIAADNVMQKVASATAGHIATLNANGEVVDSGDTVATDAEVTAMLNEVWGAESGNGD